MKKKLAKILCVALALVTVLATGAMAAETAGPKVRVNGMVVDFPDGQPYVDENGRTMIPVRFATEALGADVSWDNTTRTATISKNGIAVAMQIGSPTLKVTKDGKTTTVEMDTAAVTKDGRTYVPIRYVAEALGAKVDYSDKHTTVGIYQDVLTADEITRLQSYDYTQPEDAVGYEEAMERWDQDRVDFLYGDRTGFETFANAREFLYHAGGRATAYYFPSLNKTLTGASNDEFFRTVVEEAAAEVNYQSERVTVTFHTDTSCLYKADCMSRSTTSLRGIVEVRLHVKPTELKSAEVAMLVKLGFSKLYQDKTMYIDVDIHMNTQTDCNVNIHTIVPLCEAYE